MYGRSAARPKCSYSATATKYLMWLSSICALFSFRLSIMNKKLIGHLMAPHHRIVTT